MPLYVSYQLSQMRARSGALRLPCGQMIWSTMRSKMASIP